MPCISYYFYSNEKFCNFCNNFRQHSTFVIFLRDISRNPEKFCFQWNHSYWPSKQWLKFKGRRSASKFRKSQVRKFVGLNNLLDLRTLCKYDTSRFCWPNFFGIRGFGGPNFFTDLKLPQRHIFLLTNIAYNAVNKICANKKSFWKPFRTVSSQSCAFPD